jgi:3-isopropylmalate/(R)-2-methylmalate dehydratase small subunit
MEKVRGRARKFGDNIDTDTITPAPTLHLPPEEMKRHAFEPIKPNFCETVKQGDIIVAGHNFGCGSSREQATDVVRELGIRYIVCESMARIYFRNCIALGLYPIMANGVSSMFNEGDEVEIDLAQGVVKNPKISESASFKPLVGTTKELLEGGGILPVLKRIVEESQ